MSVNKKPDFLSNRKNPQNQAMNPVALVKARPNNYMKRLDSGFLRAHQVSIAGKWLSYELL
jgi:hypothetical protein